MRFRLQVARTLYGSNFEPSSLLEFTRTIFGGLKRLEALGFRGRNAIVISAPHHPDECGRAFVMGEIAISEYENRLRLEEFCAKVWKDAEALSEMSVGDENYKTKGMELDDTSKLA